MKLAIAQINTTIGDFDGNASKIISYIQRAKTRHADVVIFPELCVCGYPPRDLLEKPTFVRRNLDTVMKITTHADGIAIVIGFVSVNEAARGRGLFNSAAVLTDGIVRFTQHKTLLPQYDVFDEVRHFEPATEHATFELCGKRIGLTICEDLWSRYEFSGRRLYDADPVEILKERGAELILNISASPYSLGKKETRLKLTHEAAVRSGAPIVYCNLVGGNDELVFDGRSFVVNARGEMVSECKAFEEDLVVIDADEIGGMAPVTMRVDGMTEVEAALKLGLGDYMRKCGFSRAVIGLSGGVDSAVVAAVAAGAVGPKNVTGVLMPSPYTSRASVDDALELAANLGIETITVPIIDIYEAYRKTLGFSKKSMDISLAEENIQARIRGNILMAISNRDGSIVLSTGNKSEVSVGYCTLYGDMAGGLAVISDIPKTMVYGLARHFNMNREVIPQNIIDKAPTAELKPGQTDQQSLPPYEVLDPIIDAYVARHMDIDSIVSMGFDRTVVEKVARMIGRNEYKRRQAAPGIKVTSKAYGIGRRFPIACKT